jgi:hypothetical protein
VAGDRAGIEARFFIQWLILFRTIGMGPGGGGLLAQD